MNRFIQMIPASVTAKVGRQLLIGQKHSPTILFAGGVVGVIATTIVASRATLKASVIIEKSKDDLKTARTLHESGHKDYSEDDFKKDVLYVYSRTAVDLTKLYGPAVLLGVGSIAALTGSHTILTKRNAGLTAAYAVLDQSFQEYRKRVIDEHGKDADDRFRFGSKEHVVAQSKDGTKASISRVGDDIPSGYARFFDQFSNSWSRTPEYNLFFLRCQQNYANDLLKSRGHVFLNEVYDMLGIDRSKSGAVVGWVLNGEGDDFIDFGVFNGDNPRARDFVNGREGAILLDFNVDGVIYDKI